MTATVHLWVWRVDACVDASCLTAEEKARASRFLRRGDGLAFMTSRAQLRHLLGNWLGLPPERLDIRIGDYGKPYILGGPQFNLSHSGNWGLLGITRDLPIGVDLQVFSSVDRDLPKFCFSHREREALSQVPEQEWTRTFHRVWTRKEAIVKALGLGLSYPLDSFDVSVTDRPELFQFRGGSPFDWTLFDLSIAPDVASTVAVLSKGSSVAIRRHNF